MASINNLTSIIANEIYKITNTGLSEISDQFATIEYVDNNSNGVSQTDFDNSIATLNGKDISYNNTLQSHIVLLSNHEATITSNLTDISILNTKHQQNFFNISSTTHLLNTDYYTKTEIDANNWIDATALTPYATTATLTTNYQTNTQLATNYYNKTEIDANNWIGATALTPYATTATLTANYQTNTQLATNYYNKTEVDALVGAGSGYTDTQIDNLLDLRVPKSDFENRFSTNPFIDCSAPTFIHSGLTLKNETINIEPTNGLIFGNAFGGGDKVVSVFKNATNYITLQGNKIIANQTSDDSVVDLSLNPSGNVNITDDLTVSNVNVTSNINLTDTNTSLERYSNTTKANVSMDVRTDQEAIRLMLGASTDADTNTYIECNSNTNNTTFFKEVRFREDITLNGANVYLPVTSTGIVFNRPSGNAWPTMTIRDGQGAFQFF